MPSDAGCHHRGWHHRICPRSLFLSLLALTLDSVSSALLGAFSGAQASYFRRCVHAYLLAVAFESTTAAPVYSASLSSGGSVFLLSSLSHDDVDQWSLFPHFFKHYQVSLGIRPELFLLILHSDSKNHSGLARMSQKIRAKYGVLHTYPVVDPYTARSHWEVKVRILHQHVHANDWVVQVDADELIFFPHHASVSATVVLDHLDREGYNVQYGMMIDRIAHDGNVDQAMDPGISPFIQFPMNCLVTWLVQHSDIRKASAYRGYLRSGTGNHDIIGLNRSWMERLERAHRLKGEARARKRLMALLRGAAGEEVYEQLPGRSEGRLYEVRPAPFFASVFHFKWMRGLAQKLLRRAETEEISVGQYADIREMLGQGRRFDHKTLVSLCQSEGGEAYERRALSTRELLDLFSTPSDRERLDLSQERCERSFADEKRCSWWVNQMSMSIARDMSSMPVA